MRAITWHGNPAAVPPSQTRWSKVRDRVRELAYLHAAVHRPGTVDEAAETEHRRLGVVEDRGGAVDPEAAVVVEGEGSRR
jgi:hypothetical protein